MEYSKKKHSPEYERYIKSEQWQFKRVQRLEIDGHKCCMCGRPEDTIKGGLRVHHINYNSLMHENVHTDICCLCPKCHRLMHNYWERPR